MRISVLLLLAFSVPAFSQDSETVLFTSVLYNTQKASNTQLTEEQRKEADRLGAQAMQLGLAGKFGEAMRNFHQGLALMNGVSWTGTYQLAASMQAKVDHALAQPGKPVVVKLTTLYATTIPAEQSLTAVLVLRPAKGGGAEKILTRIEKIDAAALPQTIAATMPVELEGNDVLEVRLAPVGGEADPKAKATFTKSIPVHVESLGAAIAGLRTRLAGAKGQDTAAFVSAEYVVTLYDRVDSGAANAHRYDFRKEIATATAMIDALDGGVDPLASMKGDFRRAYRSDVDKTLQPYRMFVPKEYDGTKATPLVIALHGMGGDEDSMFDNYAQNLKREAARLGFLVACPKGRTIASMYRGTAEKDVMDVLAEVRRDYKVDSSRVYLMGHSMGGFGTWSIAMNHPEVFAALGPFAGGGQPGGMVKIKHIPQYVVHGDNDKTVAVGSSRSMVEAGKKAGATIEYVEVPGGSHNDVVAPRMGAMLDFFAKQHKAEAGGGN